MTEKIARRIVLAARPQGRPKPCDFRLEEPAVPTLIYGNARVTQGDAVDLLQ